MWHPSSLPSITTTHTSSQRHPWSLLSLLILIFINSITYMVGVGVVLVVVAAVWTCWVVGCTEGQARAMFWAGCEGHGVAVGAA